MSFARYLEARPLTTYRISYSYNAGREKVTKGRGDTAIGQKPWLHARDRIEELPFPPVCPPFLRWRGKQGRDDDTAVPGRAHKPIKARSRCSRLWWGASGTVAVILGSSAGRLGG